MVSARSRNRTGGAVHAGIPALCISVEAAFNSEPPCAKQQRLFCRLNTETAYQILAYIDRETDGAASTPEHVLPPIAGPMREKVSPQNSEECSLTPQIRKTSRLGLSVSTQGSRPRRW